MSNQSKGRTGGVIPINAVMAKKANASQKPTQRVPAPKLRLIIRRLPPGLTESEFWEALGPGWRSGNGQVDWHAFKEGKISKDPSKPSRPGRAYLKVKEQTLLEALSTAVKAASFKDAKNTNGDSCLIGPPSLEFAPYNKVPGGRNRHDGRQGTIDQDQEFIDFLQSLTEPISRPAVNGPDDVETKTDKVTTTPLIQFIKEKKANKAKEKEAAAAAKNSKKNQEGKEARSKGESRPTVVVKSHTAAADKAKVSKATQEVVKAANKAAAQIQSKTPAVKSEPKAAKEVLSPTVASPAPASASGPKPERQRGSASAASRMIARDLGLVPKEPRPPRAAKNASTAAATATATAPAVSENSGKTDHQQKAVSPSQAKAAKTNNSVTNSTSTPSSTPAPAPPTGPKKDRTAQTTQAKGTQQAAQRSNKQAPSPTSGAKSAFLKHANPSQGVTEELLRTIFSEFGEVTRCEIDKKKGLGYVDFTDTEALKKAMAASPVKIGNGQVVVLENRSPYHKNKGQSNSTAQQQARSSSPNSSAVSVPPPATTSGHTPPQPPPAVVATAEPTAATEEPSPPDASAAAESDGNKGSQAQTSTAPTAPKGGRSGNAATRGARGNAAFASSRGGNFNQNSDRDRGRGRGGSRGRGGRSGRSGGNAGPAASSQATSTPTQAANPSAATSDPAKPGPVAEKSAE